MRGGRGKGDLLVGVVDIDRSAGVFDPQKLVVDSVAEVKPPIEKSPDLENARVGHLSGLLGEFELADPLPFFVLDRR